MGVVIIALIHHADRLQTRNTNLPTEYSLAEPYIFIM